MKLIYFSAMSVPNCRLGVLIPRNKKLKIKLPSRILPQCASQGIEVVDIDDEEQLYTNGPYDVLLHKITDYHNELSHVEACAKMERIHDYCSKQTDMVLLDPFEGSEMLTDRFQQTKLMKSCQFELDGIKVFLPKSVEIGADSTSEGASELISSLGMKFPLLVKPGIASITETSHDMRLVFCSEHLRDLILPCVAQEFCNHSGIVYKIYIIGERIFLFERPSIRDVDCASRESLYFDTREISKLGKSYNPELHGEDPNARTWLSCAEKPDLLNGKVVAELSRRVQEATKLQLLGIDVLVESATGNYALIDVNQFPGYSGIREEHFCEAFVDLIKSCGGKKC